MKCSESISDQIHIKSITLVKYFYTCEVLVLINWLISPSYCLFVFVRIDIWFPCIIAYVFKLLGTCNPDILEFTLVES